MYNMYHFHIKKNKGGGAGQRHVRLTVDSKLPVDVTVSVNGCLSLYVSPVMNWRLVQGSRVCLPRPRPMLAGTGSRPLHRHHPTTMQKEKWLLITNEWINFHIKCLNLHNVGLHTLSQIFLTMFKLRQISNSIRVTALTSNITLLRVRKEV